MIPKLSKKLKKKARKHSENKCKNGYLESQSYLSLLRESKSASHIFIVLDARNPISCRYAPFEKLINDKLTFILNKIDLVPRETAIGWYSVLKQTAPTIAISATTSIDPLPDYIKSLGKSQILITGIENVGKNTIVQGLPQIDNLTVQTETWNWLQSTPDLVILKAIDKIPPECDVFFGVRDIIARSSIQSLMDAFNITFFSDPDRLLMTIHRLPPIAARSFFSGLSSGKYPFYTIPPATSISTVLTEDEKNQFKASKVYDAFETPFIMIGYGTENTMKYSVTHVLQQIADEKRQNASEQPEQNAEIEIFSKS